MWHVLHKTNLYSPPFFFAESMFSWNNNRTGKIVCFEKKAQSNGKLIHLFWYENSLSNLMWLFGVRFVLGWRYLTFNLNGRIEDFMKFVGWELNWKVSSIWMVIWNPHLDFSRFNSIFQRPKTFHPSKWIFIIPIFSLKSKKWRKISFNMCFRTL